MCRICLINPKFPVSFWGVSYGLKIVGKDSNMPILALPTLAALTPLDHEIILLDENIEEINFDTLESFDIVGLTGMTVQCERMREILIELKKRNIFTILGGPWITLSENWFKGLVDVVFIGEAEETWPRFLEEWARGEHAERYEQAEKTDMVKVPLPRYDLVPFHKYAMGCVQTSRGCPFQCEFCDIIIIFGRKPRIKTPEQVIAEIDAQYRMGCQIIFLVDDNFIGNKKASKDILRAIIKWQRKHGYPLSFFTEASLDLAEDDELLQLMAEAGFIYVFVGIETPNEDSLRETKKYQNLRGKNSIIDKVHKIQKFGLEVYAGMIVGFDCDDLTIFEKHYELIDQARIICSMTGMLNALPKTPLYERLKSANRLNDGNITTDMQGGLNIATNIIPLKMTVKEMHDGWLDLMVRMYDGENYFKRFEDLFIKNRIPVGTTKTKWLRRNKPLSYLKMQAITILLALYILIRIWTNPITRPYRPVYAKYLRKLLISGRPPRYLFDFACKCIMHTHFAIMIDKMVRGESRLINT